jgi:hypothetical protein
MIFFAVRGAAEFLPIGTQKDVLKHKRGGWK